MKKVSLIGHLYTPILIYPQSETFSPPNSQQAARGAQYIDSYHGYNGPVQVTFPNDMYGGPEQQGFIDSIVSLTGINRYKDLNGGTPNCVSMTPLVRNIPLRVVFFDVLTCGWS